MIGTDMAPLLEKEGKLRQQEGQKAGQKKATEAATKKRTEGESLDRHLTVKGEDEASKQCQEKEAHLDRPKAVKDSGDEAPSARSARRPLPPRLPSP